MPFSYISGAGTQQNPYIISDVQGWNEFIEHVRTSANSMAGEYVQLGANIVFNDITDFDTWGTTAPANVAVPMYEYNYGVSDLDCHFAGNFDGNGYKFVGVYASSIDEYYHYYRFIYSEGKMSNLIFDHCYLDFEISDPDSDGDYDNGGQLIYNSYHNDNDSSDAGLENIHITNSVLRFKGRSLMASAVMAYSVNGIYVDSNTVIKAGAATNTLIEAPFVDNVYNAAHIDVNREYPYGFSVYTIACSEYSNYISASRTASHCMDATTVTIVHIDQMENGFSTTVTSLSQYEEISYCGNIGSITLADNALTSSTINLNVYGISEASDNVLDVNNCYAKSSIDIGEQSYNLNSLKVIGIADTQYGPKAADQISHCFADVSLGIDSNTTVNSTTYYNLSSRSLADSYYRANMLPNAADGISLLDDAAFADSSNFHNFDFTDTWILEDTDHPVLQDTPETHVFPGDVEPQEDPLEPVLYALTLGKNYSDWGTVTGAGSYAAGTEVQITAVPVEGKVFVRWNDGDTNVTRTITMPEDDVSYTAGFGHALTVLTEDAEKGTVTGTSLHCPGEYQQIEAIPSEGYQFSQWNDGSTVNPRSVAAGDSTTTYTAYFEVIVPDSFTVTLDTNGDYGSVSGDGEYEDGTEVEISATADEGYVFDSWSDGDTNATRTITVDQDITLTARFALRVTVTINDVSMGRIQCEGLLPELDPLTGDQTGVYSGNVMPNTSKVINAIPAQGYVFTGWSDGRTSTSIAIDVTSAVNISGTFVIGRTVTLSVNDATMGSVRTSPEIDVSELIPDGYTFTLYAVATPDHRFVTWNDNNTNAERIITMDSDKDLEATFEVIPIRSVTLDTNDSAKGVVTGAGNYAEGGEAVVAAIANPGFRFVTWSDGNGSATRTLTIGESDINLTALFETVFEREIDLSRYKGRLGRIKSHGVIYSTITILRTVNKYRNYCAELGQFDTNTGKHFIFLSVKDALSLSCKQYSLALNHNHTSNEWMRAEPVDESDITDTTYQVEVKSDGVSAAIRIKYVGDTEDGTKDFQIILQNLGMEDENWIDGDGDGHTYIDDTEVPGMISSVPSGAAVFHDHLHLANRGNHTHAEIDAHIDHPNPHPGHELISDKNVADGYAGLDANAKVPLVHLPIGGGDNQLVMGNDPRLSDDRYPTHHAASHTAEGDDVLSLMDLEGNLTQARSHDDADTDDSENSLHHTIGIGPTQAAAGDHLHDERYAPIAQGVLGGNTHNHDGDNTARVDHEDLIHHGAYSHDQIDAHIEATTPHSGHEDKANKDVAGGYAGLNARGKLKSEEIEFGSGAGSVCEGNDPRLNDARPPAAHAAYHAENGSDPITISTLAGNLTQARTHDSADTDALVSSLHHTIGTSATQAAAGNHLHDERYAPISMQLADNDTLGPNFTVSATQDGYVLGSENVVVTVETGETDPETGDPVTTSSTVLKTRMRRLKHSDLDGAGTYDHDDIDQFINDAVQYEVVARRGQPEGYASLDANGKIPMSQMPDGTSTKLSTVATYADLLALQNVEDSIQILVLDASGDGTVDSGWATYIYSEAINGWKKLSEQESMDVVIDWSNLTGKPSATTTQIDNTVAASHAQNSDIKLAEGTADEISAADINAHIGANNPHPGHEVVANKGQANGYASLDQDGLVPVSQLPASFTPDSALTASHATTADSATTATSANTAQSAAHADSATTAESALIADGLAVPFELEITGDASGTAVIDGTENVTLQLTIPDNSVNFSLMSDAEIAEIIV